MISFAGIQTAGATTLSQSFLNVVDTNPDPHIFEAALSADEQVVNINGTEVDALIYKDDNRAGGYPTVEANGNALNTCKEVVDGETVLVNGQNPGAGIPTITAKAGAGIRLRLINTETNRYYRLAVTGNSADNNLYRIGGEGGFLEQVRLEGGILGTWDTK